MPVESRKIEPEALSGIAALLPYITVHGEILRPGDDVEVEQIKRLTDIWNDNGFDQLVEKCKEIQNGHNIWIGLAIRLASINRKTVLNHARFVKTINWLYKESTNWDRQHFTLSPSTMSNFTDASFTDARNIYYSIFCFIESPVEDTTLKYVQSLNLHCFKACMMRRYLMVVNQQNLEPGRGELETLNQIKNVMKNEEKMVDFPVSQISFELDP